MANGRSADEFRSPLARDARVLLDRVVDAIADAKQHRAQSLELLQQSRERVAWSDTLVDRSLSIRDRLRDSVAALASLERTKGVPPEKMLMLLKGMVLDAEVEKLDVAVARSLMNDVVRWGIEAYYAA